MKRVLGKPHAGKPRGVGRLRQGDAGMRVEPAMQAQPDPRQGVPAHTPPGRGASLAGEKCTCTTRQSPASLRNTIVERDTKFLP